MIAWRRSRWLIAASALVGSAAGAQGAPSAKLPGAQICDMSFRVLIMQVVDSSGAPVRDATLLVRRVRTGVMIDRPNVSDDGSYQILEDGALRDLRRTGEPFDVTFAKGKRARRARVRIGMDAGGCHVRFIVVPPRVVL